MADELCEVKIDHMTTATVRCGEGDYQADAHDTAEVPAILGEAAMHAMSTGHTVHEHVAQDLTVRPVP